MADPRHAGDSRQNNGNAQGGQGDSRPDDSRKMVRVAAVGDLHFTRTSQGTLQSLFAQIAESADVLLLCGDLTDHGTSEEAQVLVKELAAAGAGSKLPTLAVLGNHDFESDAAADVTRALSDAGVKVLDGDAVELHGVGFVGVKGFAGGFGRGTLGSFGEPSVKAFVKEALDEAMKLESGLMRLRTEHKIAVLHYAPVRATVEGEPLEIFPYLGCSRLEEPLNRYQVTAVVHGHAHRGAPEGRTAAGAPVYNVALPLMRCAYPDRPPFRLLDVSVPAEGAATAPAASNPPVAAEVS